MVWVFNMVRGKFWQFGRAMQKTAAHIYAKCILLQFAK